MPDAQTRLFGILGYPIPYTKSPQLQTGMFRKNGVNAVYLSFPTPEEQLETFLAFARIHMGGFNVTIPYKEKIMPYLEKTDRFAELCGAVNTVKVENGKFYGYNTDGAGGKRCLERLTELSGKKVFLKGAGGAARGLAAALCGSCEILIDARGKQKAQGLVHDLNSAVPGAKLALWEGQKAEILINATPLGSTACPGIPFTEEQVAAADTAFDAVYDPQETELLKLANALGKKTVPGMDMLIEQGVLAQEIFRKGRSL